jgi:hypothetical protein
MAARTPGTSSALHCSILLQPRLQRSKNKELVRNEIFRRRGQVSTVQKRKEGVKREKRELEADVPPRLEGFAWRNEPPGGMNICRNNKSIKQTLFLGPFRNATPHEAFSISYSK